jgi:hypothetical protein
LASGQVIESKVKDQTLDESPTVNGLALVQSQEMEQTADADEFCATSKSILVATVATQKGLKRTATLPHALLLGHRT